VKAVQKRHSCSNNYRNVIQEAQLLQRDRAMLCVIKYFVKSLKIIRSDVCKSDKYFNDIMSVCRTVSEIFSVKEWRDIETG